LAPRFVELVVTDHCSSSLLFR